MSDDQAAREILAKQCNKLVNGSCFTHGCLKRGGYKQGGIDDPSFNNATCEYLEAVQAFAELAALRAKVEEQAKELERVQFLVSRKQWAVDTLATVYQRTKAERDNALAAARQENQARFVAGLQAAQDVLRKWLASRSLARITLSEAIYAIDARIAEENKEGG